MFKQLNRMTQQQPHLYSSKTLGYMAADMTSRYEMAVCFSFSCTDTKRWGNKWQMTIRQQMATKLGRLVGALQVQVRQ